MDPKKRKDLESAGWVFEDAEDFLELTEEERRLVDLRLAVSRAVRDVRLGRKLTQSQAAKILGTSQARLSNIEAASADVSLDLMFRSLFVLGGTMGDVNGPRAAKRPKGASKPAVPVAEKRRGSAE